MQFLLKLKRNIRSNNRGQTIVEYTLLLAAVITVFLALKPMLQQFGISLGPKMGGGIFSEKADAEGFYYFPMKK
jgi:Flp pilus assembly pilin Flp